VQILNRGDCCGKRLNGAKIYVGDKLFATINDPPSGDWYTAEGRIAGKFIKI
jgi:hypothetical protein